MSTLEDLNRIKKANDILNKGFQKVGAKPIYVDPTFDEPTKEIHNNFQHLEFNFKPQIELLNQVSSKLKKEKEKGKARKKIQQSKKSDKFLNLIIAICVITLIYTCFYVYTPERIIDKVKSLTQKIIRIPESANANAETNLSEAEVIARNSAGEKAFIITSGIFKNQSDASHYKNELSKKLGVPLATVKAENFYTIQVGPDYQEQEDVLVVFDELSRYNIKNLSIRVQ